MLQLLNKTKMNNKLPIYAYAIASAYFLFIGIVIGQNFAKQPEGNQLQASIIPTTIPTSSITNAVTSAQAAATKTATTTAQNAATKLVSTSNLNLPTSISGSLPSTTTAVQTAQSAASSAATKLSAIQQQISGNLSTTAKNVQTTATAAASAATNQVSANNLSLLKNISGNSLPSTAEAAQLATANKQITDLKLPLQMQDMNLTDAQKKILGERLTTLKDTACPNVASGGVNATTACPGVSAQIGNIAGIQQSIPNVSLPSGISALSGLSGIASKMGVSDISNLTNIGNLSSLSNLSGLQNTATNALKSSVTSKLGL